MIARITFEDGTVDEVNLKPMRLADAETYLASKKIDPSQAMFKMSMVAAWIAKGRPSTFDAWGESIDNFETVEAPTVDPTSGPSLDESPTSP